MPFLRQHRTIASAHFGGKDPSSAVRDLFRVHMMHDTRRNVPSHCKRHDKGKNNVGAGAKVWYTGKNTSRQRSSEKHEARSVFGEVNDSEEYVER